MYLKDTLNRAVLNGQIFRYSRDDLISVSVVFVELSRRGARNMNVVSSSRLISPHIPQTK